MNDMSDTVKEQLDRARRRVDNMLLALNSIKLHARGVQGAGWSTLVEVERSRQQIEDLCDEAANCVLELVEPIGSDRDEK